MNLGVTVYVLEVKGQLRPVKGNLKAGLLDGKVNLSSDSKPIEVEGKFLNFEVRGGFSSANIEGGIAVAKAVVEYSSKAGIETSGELFSVKGTASFEESDFEMTVDNSAVLGAGER